MPSKVGEVYARELQEVRSQAIALDEAIDRHNFLPDDFPKPQIRLLLRSLTGLVDGSLEGTKLPLEHAATRISEVRRRHFLHIEGNHSPEVDDSSPVLQRGDALDSHFSAVLTSIHTALAAYREQTRSEIESTNSDEYISILPAINAGKSDIESIETQISELNDLATFATESRWSKEDSISTTARSAADARNYLISTEAEISFGFIVNGWIKRLALTSADALKILSVSIEAVSVSGGVAYEFYKKYKSTLSRIRDVVIDEAQEWLSFIKSHVEAAERGIRRKYSDNETRRVGVVKDIGNRRIVVSHDNIPFAISRSEKNVPAAGETVEFVVEVENDIFFAKEIKQTFNYIIVNNNVHSTSSAAPIVMSELRGLILNSKNNSIMKDRLLALSFKHLGLPNKYWNILGFSTFDDFVKSNPEWYPYPNKGSPVVISLIKAEEKEVTSDIIKDWVYEYLRNEGVQDIRVVASRTIRYFKNINLTWVGGLSMEEFSEILTDDPRFRIRNNKIQARHPDEYAQLKLF